MRIALEAMGDFPLEPLVAGAVAAARADNHLRITLVGNENHLQPHLRSLGKLGSRFNTASCSQTIGSAEPPDQALRIKPDSSVARCWQLLVEQKVEAVVMHSPPAAVAAAGLRFQRLLEGVRHPTLAVAVQTLKRVCVLADVGARAQPPATHLYQSGVMASVIAEQLFCREAPVIGLLPLSLAGRGGTPDALPLSSEGRGGAPDGADALRETHRLFMESPYQIRFAGAVSAAEVLSGQVDVAACTPESGNSLLRLAQGQLDELPHSEQDGMRAILPQLPVRFVQAGFLAGIEGACILTFGQTSAAAIQDSLGWAAHWYAVGLNRQIIEKLAVGPLGGLAV